MSVATENIFLFSVDLEDLRLRMPDGHKYKARVDVLVDEYLQFLRKHKSHCTFFTVGDIPAEYPGLIKKIISEGHEIACHSNKHMAIADQTKEEFRADVLNNIAHLKNAGATEIIGYRAPMYSLTKETPWAHEVLAELGFKYSSSVLPAKNPLYGWEGFGEQPQKINSHIWEIPVSIRNSKVLNVPFSGGAYFRVLPMSMIKRGFKQHFDEGLAITSYFHPYDIDTHQEKFRQPGINESWFYNKLMYYNRNTVFTRLEMIMKTFDAKIITYKQYYESLNG